MRRSATFIALLLSSAPALAAETTAYAYDARGRLIQVARSGTVNNGATTTYQFDKADNRLAMTTTGAARRSFVVPLRGGTVIMIGP